MTRAFESPGVFTCLTTQRGESRSRGNFEVACTGRASFFHLHPGQGVADAVQHPLRGQGNGRSPAVKGGLQARRRIARLARDGRPGQTMSDARAARLSDEVEAELDGLAGPSDENLEITRRDGPVPALDVVIRERAPVERNGHAPRLAGLQLHFCKAFQFLGRPGHVAVGVGDVYLRDLGAFASERILVTT